MTNFKKIILAILGLSILLTYIHTTVLSNKVISHAYRDDDNRIYLEIEVNHYSKIMYVYNFTVHIQKFINTTTGEEIPVDEYPVKVWISSFRKDIKHFNPSKAKNYTITANQTIIIPINKLVFKKFFIYILFEHSENATWDFIKGYLVLEHEKPPIAYIISFLVCLAVVSFSLGITIFIHKRTG